MISFNRKISNDKPETKLIWIDDLTFTWVDEVKSAMIDHQSVWLIAENCSYSGVIGMVNCLKQEPGGDQIRYIKESHLQYNNNFLGYLKGVSQPL